MELPLGKVKGYKPSTGETGSEGGERGGVPIQNKKKKGRSPGKGKTPGREVPVPI